MSEDIKNGILDLIYFSEPDFDSEFVNLSVTPDELLQNLGLAELQLPDLLDLLERGANDIEEAWNTRLFDQHPGGMERYCRIGMRFGAVALAVYDRLFSRGEEPRLPPYLAVNRYTSSNCHPNCVLFWADVDAVTGLYQALKADGYYENDLSTK